MKKILLSLSMIAVVGVIVLGATGAFFSDTETSTGNTFTAGAIDLTVDNESYVTNSAGVLVASINTSWTLSDLTGQLFFNFADLKPGDIGEDTISLHVDNNDSWLCAAAQITDDSDQTCTEPELADDSTCTNPGLGEGELGSELNFTFWADDGDNVYEVGENIFLDGPISNIGQAGKITLADSGTNIWNNPVAAGPLPGNSTRYIGKAWCFGTLSSTNVPQDGGITSGPLDGRGTGFTCSGVSVDNASQTDKVMGDIQFYAEQSRNNALFTCANNYTPTWPQGAQRPLVGANDFEGYQTQAAHCDVTVDENGSAPQTIQQGLADAAALGGPRTVCVEDGDYTGPIDIEMVGLTLHSNTGPSNTATITGDVNINADSVTVEGFDIDGKVASDFHDVIIRYNNADGGGSGSAIGFGGSSGIGSTITNNVVTNAGQRGIYLDQNGTEDFVVTYNTISARKNGFGSESSGSFQRNVVSGYDVSNGIGFEVEYDSGNISSAPVISINNFNEAGMTGYAVANNGSTTFDAPSNWWGNANPAGHFSGAVTAGSPEASAYPEN